MKNRVVGLIILLVVALSKPGSGQSPQDFPAVERGSRSIVLELGSTSQIGYWMRTSDRADLGLDVSINGFFGESLDGITVGITPALKRYLSSDGALAPYTYFGIPVSYSRTHSENTGAPDTTDDRYSVGGVAGFGLEWLPVRQVSIGGHVGLRAAYSHDQNGYAGMFSLGTYSSGVRVHLYF